MKKAKENATGARRHSKGEFVRGGERYLDASAAARIVDVVSPATLRRWIKAGWTSFGMPLDVIPRRGRLFIPEFKAGALKEHLEDYPLPKPGTSREAREEFKRAAEFYTSMLRPRSAYSRARTPRPKSPHP